MKLSEKQAMQLIYYASISASSPEYSLITESCKKEMNDLLNNIEQQQSEELRDLDK